MSSSAWYLDAMRAEDDRSEFHDDHNLQHGNAAFAAAELVSGERIGAPLRRGSGKALRRGAFCSIITLAGAVAFSGAIGGLPELPGWLSDIVASVRDSLQHDVSAGRASDAASPAASPAQVAALQPLEASDVGARGVSAGEPTASAPSAGEIPQTDATASPDTLPAGTEPAEVTAAPLPPPKFDPADPYQKKAVAAGLHPDLSRVLLAKLTVADYKNAGVAINKALSEADDGDVFVWPREAKAKLAMFEVQFVPGAAPDCRRYVVRVTKDGWLTTALPMEKCGVVRTNNPKEPKRAQERKLGLPSFG